MNESNSLGLNDQLVQRLLAADGEVIVDGLSDWTLSAGESLGGGRWRVAAADLESLEVIPGDAAAPVANVQVTVAGSTELIVLPLGRDDVRADAASGFSELTFSLGAHHYQGGPQFRVLVNGEQIGDVYEVAADARAGELERFTFVGDFGDAGPDDVEIEFLNDLWEGDWNRDRNLIVDSLEVNGTVFRPEEASYERSWGSTVPGRRGMVWGGTMSFDTGANGGPPPLDEFGQGESFAIDPVAWLATQPVDAALAGIAVGGVPDGAVLSAGTRSADGTWTVAASDLPALRVTAPLGFTADFTLSATIVHQLADGQSLTTLVEHQIDVDEAGAVPALSRGSDLSSVEINVSGRHFDGAPQFRMRVDGEPVGGVYTVDADHALGERQTFVFQGEFGATGPGRVEVEFLNDRWDGEIENDRNLIVESIVVNGRSFLPDGANYLTTSGRELSPRATMNVNGTLDFDTQASPPNAVVTVEDGWASLGLSASFGAEDLVDEVLITGVPEGAVVEGATRLGDGRWQASSEAIGDLVIVPAPDAADDFVVTVSVAGVTAGGEPFDSTIDVPVQVIALADAPLLTTTAVGSTEDAGVALDIEATTADLDGSESISQVAISGLPEGVTLSAGTQVRPGTWHLTPDELPGLMLTPVADGSDNLDVRFELTVSATATEADNGGSRTVVRTLPIHMDARADGVELTTPATLSIIQFRVSGDAYTVHPEFSGPPEFYVLVDGEQVGGLRVANADIDRGEWEEFQIRGDWGAAGPQSVAVEFTNDLWCSPGCDDRDLIVDHVVVNGAVYEAEDASYLRYGMRLDDVRDLCPPDKNVEAWMSELTGEELDALRETVQLDGRERLSWNGRLGFETADNGGPAGAGANEDTAVPIGLLARLIDADGSERIESVIIENVPDGASLSQGENLGNGAWALAPDDLQGLSLSPAPDSADDFAIDIVVTTVETANGNAATQRFQVPVALHAVADVPVLEVVAEPVQENDPFALNILGALGDLDGSETLTFEVSGLPDGASLSAGIPGPDGTWTLSADEATDLMVHPPTTGAPAFVIDVVAVATERDGDQARTAREVRVPRMAAAAVAPLVIAGDAAGVEDNAIALSIAADVADLDSERITQIAVTGLPDGASLSAGREVRPGVWQLEPEALDGLLLNPPRDFAGQFELSVAVTATEAASGATATTIQPLRVEIEAVADGVVMTGPDAVSVVQFRVSGDAYEAVPDFAGPPEFYLYVNGEQVGGLRVANADINAGEWEEFQVRGDWGPAGPQTVSVEFTNDLWCSPGCDDRDLIVDHVVVNGSPFEAEDATYLRYGMRLDDVRELSPPDKEVAQWLTELTAAQLDDLRETISLDGRERLSWNGKLTFDTSANGGPHGAEGREDAAVPFALMTRLVDLDGSEAIQSITVTGLPPGAGLSAGTRQDDGSWLLATDDLVGLHVQGAPNQDDDFTLQVEVVTAESSGDLISQSLAVPVVVHAVADLPRVSASAQAAFENEVVALDIAGALTDVDGSEALRFVVADVPEGATLSAGERGADGSWTLQPDDLDGLTITPAPDSAEDFVLSVSAVAREARGGDEAIATVALPVEIKGLATDLAVAADATTVQEDQVAALSLILGTPAGEGEIVTALISGMPADARLSAGRDNEDGTWTLTGEELVGLQIRPPENSDVDFELGYAVTVTDPESGDRNSYTGRLPVVVDAAADAPMVTDGQGRIGDTISVRVSGRAYAGAPQFRVLVDGEQVGEVVTVQADRWQNEWQTVTVRGHWGPDGPASVEIDYLNDFEAGDWTRDRNLHVEEIVVNGQAFAAEVARYQRDFLPEIDGQDAMVWGGSLVFDVSEAPPAITLGTRGRAGESAPLNLGVELVDTDGSEGLAGVLLSGFPDGVVPTRGTPTQDGWFLTNAELAQAALALPDDLATDFVLSVTAFASEGEGDSLAQTVTSLPVEVVPRELLVSVSDTAGGEDLWSPVVLTGWLPQEADLALMDYLFELPQGATLNAGEDLGNGQWRVPGAEIATVQVRAPANFSGTFDASVSLIDPDDPDREGLAADTFTVTIEAIADGPRIDLRDATVKEDQPIALKVALGLRDTDGSERLADTIVIAGVPEGARLSAGLADGDGNWSLTLSELDGVTLTPPANAVTDFVLTVHASTVDENGDVASAAQVLNVKVVGVADAPQLLASDVIGAEDVAVPLKLDAALVDVDGSEHLDLFIAGVPTGAGLSSGSLVGDGVWRVPSEALAELELMPPAQFAGRIDLTLVGTAIEATGDVATSKASFSVVIDPTVDAPIVRALDARGAEDTAIALAVNTELVDSDGSELLEVLIAGVPDGAVLSVDATPVGEHLGDGVWAIAPEHVEALAVTPPTDFKGQFQLAVEAIAIESNGDATAVTQTFSVMVDPRADRPGLTVGAAVAEEDGRVDLSIVTSLGDSSGSERLDRVVISGLPDGAKLTSGQNNGDGSWTLSVEELTGLALTPPPDSDASFDLTVTAVAVETGPDAERIEPATSTVILPVQINAVADQPTLAVRAVSGREDQSVALKLKGTLSDTDGSETLSYVVDGVPDGAVLSAGTPLGDGRWALTAEEAGDVRLTPPRNFNGEIELAVTATATEARTDSVASVAESFVVTVKPVADRALIRTMTARGREDGGEIPLVISVGLRDIEGGEAIELIRLRGLPEDATLSAGTRHEDGSWTVTVAELDGLAVTPAPDASGNFKIRVEVTISDGDATRVSARNLNVKIKGVTDAPEVSASSVRGTEDQPIALAVDAGLTDIDGSESLTVIVAGVPKGGRLSHGKDLGNGKWSVEPDDLPGLALVPPPHFSGRLDLEIKAVAHEPGGGKARTSAPFSVHVEGALDAPAEWEAAAGVEDAPIPLALMPERVDRDGSETVVEALVSGLPVGAILSAGEEIAPGVFRIAPSEMASLTIIPPADASDNFALSVRVTIVEEDGDAVAYDRSLPVVVTGVADQPGITTVDVATEVDQPVGLVFAGDLADTDGSETLYYIVDGVPNGAGLSAGRNNGDGSWTITEAERPGLALQPGDGFEGELQLLVSAVAREEGGDLASNERLLTVAVLPPATARSGTGEQGGDGSLAIRAVRGEEDSVIALGLAQLTGQVDGSVTIEGLPEGAVLTVGIENADGTWTVAPTDFEDASVILAEHQAGQFPLKVGWSQQGVQHSAELAVRVIAEADVPRLSIGEVEGLADQPLALLVTGALEDADGSESLSFVVRDLPDGAMLNVGLRNPGTGVWSIDADDIGALAVTPPRGFVGELEFTIGAVATEASGRYATNFQTVRVEVEAVAAEASIIPTVEEGVAVRLDLVALIGDLDGLETAAILVSGIPDEARLSAGELLGDGVWSVPVEAMAGLMLTPPADFAGTLAMGLTTTITERLAGPPVTNTTPFSVTIDGGADEPVLRVGDTAAGEGAVAVLDLMAVLADLDGSEKLELRLDGLPAGAQVAGANYDGGGAWRFADGVPNAIVARLPAGADGEFALRIVATAREANGRVAAASADLRLVVDPAAAEVGGDRAPTMLDVEAARSGVDGTDPVAIVVDGLPEGARLSAGTDNGDGTWTIVDDSVTSVEITAPRTVVGDYTLSLTATALDSDSDGVTAVTLMTVAFPAIAASPESTPAAVLAPGAAIAPASAAAPRAGEGIVVGRPDDTIVFGVGPDAELGTNVIRGGDGQDVIQLANLDQDAGGALFAADWTVVLADGSTVDPSASGDDNSVAFGENTSGFIKFGDGTELEFHDIARIEW